MFLAMMLYVSSREDPSGIRNSYIRVSRNGLLSRQPMGLPSAPRARFVTVPSVCLSSLLIDSTALRRVSKAYYVGSSCGITLLTSISFSSPFLGMTVSSSIFSKSCKKNALSLLGLSWKWSSFSHSERVISYRITLAYMSATNMSRRVMCCTVLRDKIWPFSHRIQYQSLLPIQWETPSHRPILEAEALLLGVSQYHKLS